MSIALTFRASLKVWDEWMNRTAQVGSFDLFKQDGANECQSNMHNRKNVFICIYNSSARIYNILTFEIFLKFLLR